MRNSLFFLIVSLSILGGCRASKSPNPTFYVIEYPAEKESSLADSLMVLPLIVEVETVDVNPAFSAHEIALRKKSNEIGYFSHNKWATRPDQSLTRFLLTFFKRNDVFKDIDTRFWKITPDYRLKTTVHQLEVVNSDKEFTAHLHLEFRLVNTENDQVVLEHIANKSQRLTKKDLNLFADAISSMFYDELNNFTEMARTKLPND
jgi:ABC-type uncharacterized transport system auxiliary subunit